MNSGYILKAEPKEFPDRMNVGSHSVEHDSQFFWELPSSFMGKAAGIVFFFFFNQFIGFVCFFF